MLLALITLAAAASPNLDLAAAALAEYDAATAMAHLEQAQGEAPHGYEDNVRLHELLGVAHAYLGNKEQGVAAFEHLLLLDPAHAVSYTLSPKVTFLFEQARTRASRSPHPTIDLSWPRGLKVGEPLPVTVEMVANPGGVLQSAVLLWRVSGTEHYSAQPLELPEPGAYRTVFLPLESVAMDRDQAIELYLSGRDAAGNEVLRIASVDRPREIGLTYQAPTPWYAHWWLWASTGVMVSGATALAVYLALQQPPESVPITVSRN